MRDGYGEMHWTDGSCYQGEWVKGIQHGYGRMTFPNKWTEEGYFENNCFQYATEISEDLDPPITNIVVEPL